MIAVHYCISGFTQHMGRPNGVLSLSEKLMSGGHAEGNRMRVRYRRWSNDWGADAANLASLRELYGEKIVLGVYAYSWGAGWGAMQFANHLRGYGIRIRVMVLSDPVFRHPLPWRRWLSVLSRDAWGFAPLIRVPANVDEVYGFHQHLNKPQGHRLVALNGTIIHPSIRLPRIHQQMDDAPQFHKQAFRCAEMIRESISI